MITLPPIRWTRSPNFSSRNGQRVRLVVAHDCEGSSDGAISWFAQARSQVSAHLVLKEDGSEATQMVAWGNKAWHACDANPFSEGIEAAGYAAKGFGAPEFGALASLVAWRLHTNGIPCQEATYSNNWTGFTEHYRLGAMGGGHNDFTTDPAVWAGFVDRVKTAYAAGPPDEPNNKPMPVPAPPSPPGFTPSNGGRSDEVFGSIAWAQARLNAIGAAHPNLVVDGMEGSATEWAILNFQRTHGLLVDGILGPQTIKVLAA